MISEPDIKNLCINVSKELVELPNEYEGINKYPNLQNKFIFPEYPINNSIRISEQESRVLFCNKLEKYYKEIFYSIETPTTNKYRFGDKLENINIDNSGKSGMIDMTLFDLCNNEFKRSLNIEFKAHNVEQNNITKDILKLIAEEQSGLFFHTLKNIDSGTFNNKGNTGVFNKYIESINKFVPIWKECKKENKNIFFAICIIEQKVLLCKTLRDSDLDNLEHFFKIEYKPTRKTIEFTDINNWIINKL